MTEPMGERGRQGAAPLGGTDIETVRVALAATAFGSWAPEEQRPDQRVALAALSRIERVVEAARCGEFSEVDGHLFFMTTDKQARALREALEALGVGVSSE